MQVAELIAAIERQLLEAEQHLRNVMGTDEELFARQTLENMINRTDQVLNQISNQEQDTIMSTTSIDLSNLSADDLRKALAEKEEAEKKQRETEKQAYEELRENIIRTLSGRAYNLAIMIAAFRNDCMHELTGFREKMLAYGDLRNAERNKGSFSLQNQQFKIIFRSQVRKSFDERAELAEEKLKEFLEQFVKKRDLKLYRVIKNLLERNEASGDFDIDLINRLYKMEDQFDDPNWKDAIRLFKESYSPCGTAHYVQFSFRNAVGQWESLVLDIAKAKYPSDVIVEKEETA